MYLPSFDTRSCFYYSLQLFMQQAFSQTFPYRFIIQLQAQTSQYNTQCVNTQSHFPSFSQSVELILNQPCIEQIHKRIMNHINRIRYISQELTYRGRLLIRSDSRCSQPDKNRESYDNSKCFISTIYAKRLCTFQIRNRKQSNQDNGAYPECTFQPDGFEVTRQKHTQREREKHPQ